MPDTKCAFYLVGHGSRRQPRFIELQYRRIVRYRDLAPHVPEHFGPPKLFIDFNLEPQNPRAPLDRRYPQLSVLIAAIEANEIGLVYLDIRIGDEFADLMEQVEKRLEDTGAKVINVFCDDNLAVRNELSRSFGDDGTDEDINDASDFACFFPRAAYEITLDAIGDEFRFAAWETASLQPLLSDLLILKKANPYCLGRLPLISPLTKRRLMKKKAERLREKLKNKERDAT